MQLSAKRIRIVQGSQHEPCRIVLEETGISQRSLLNLMLKFMLIEGCETVLDSPSGSNCRAAACSS